MKPTMVGFEPTPEICQIMKDLPQFEHVVFELLELFNQVSHQVSRVNLFLANWANFAQSTFHFGLWQARAFHGNSH